MGIVSDDVASRARDYEHKRSDYARASIPEYWIVDPAAQKILVLTLEGSLYRVLCDAGLGAEVGVASPQRLPRRRGRGHHAEPVSNRNRAAMRHRDLHAISSRPERVRPTGALTELHRQQTSGESVNRTLEWFFVCGAFGLLCSSRRWTVLTEPRASQCERSERRRSPGVELQNVPQSPNGTVVISGVSRVLGSPRCG